MEWFDIRKCLRSDCFLYIIIGGRGIGKTYSALSYLMEEKQPFIYLRNTDTQISESASVFGNPFKKLNNDRGLDYRLESEKKHYLINEYIDNQKQLRGYGAALSTFGNLRGVDLSDVKYFILDEFIERRTLSFKQFDAFQGFYETVNRNRELSGERPLTGFLLSNAQTLNNDILLGYGLVNKITQLYKDGRHSFAENGLYFEIPESNVSEAKQNTANYKLISGTDIAREYLKNEFSHDNFTNIKKMPIQEFKPLAVLSLKDGGCTFYKHKSRGLIYAAQRPEWRVKIYDKQILFMREIGLDLRQYSIRNKIFYDTFETRLFVDRVLGC